MSNYLQPHGLQHPRLLSSTISWSSLKLMSIESVMLSNHLILSLLLFLCFQSFPASGYFPMSRLFASSGQSIRASASASALPTNIQDWFSLGVIGFISWQSKGLSRDFSNTTIQKHQFFGSQLSVWPNLIFLILCNSFNFVHQNNRDKWKIYLVNFTLIWN